MTKIQITDSKNRILPECNFTFEEFYCTLCFGEYTCNGSFMMYVCFVKALQEFRNYFSEKYGKEIKWLITSAFRPDDPDWSPHKTGDAVDSIPLETEYQWDIINQIRNEFINWKTSALVKNVLATGVNVLIIESGCLHISFREDRLNFHDDYSPQKFYIGEWRKSVTDEEKKNYPNGINTCYA